MEKFTGIKDGHGVRRLLDIKNHVDVRNANRMQALANEMNDNGNAFMHRLQHAVQILAVPPTQPTNMAEFIEAILGGRDGWPLKLEGVVVCPSCLALSLTLLDSLRGNLLDMQEMVEKHSVEYITK